MYHMYAGISGSQKPALDPLELKFQVVVSCHIDVGTELKSFVRAVNPSSHNY